MEDDPKVSNAERKKVKAWQARVKAADDAYQEWADDFRVDELEDYYSGKGQNSHLTDDERRKAYSINLCFPTLETKLPSLFYHRPMAKITPRPARGMDPGSNIPLKCQLLEDTAAQLIADEDRVGFRESIELAIQEAHYAFGVVEVGYDADIVDNPNAGAPMTNADGSEISEPGTTPDAPPVPVLQPDSLVRDESIYVKFIPACQWRFPAVSQWIVKRNDWVGYYEWVRLEDIKANVNYRHRKRVKPQGKLIEEKREAGYSESVEQDQDLRAMVKIWKVWDLRSKVKHVFPDAQSFFLREDEPVTFMPHAILRFHKHTKQAYPVPPVFNWLSPQDELNETRNAQRVHRRRFNRRYLALKGKIAPDEAQKVEDGGDGAIAWSDVPDAISPIEDAPLDRSVALNVPMTREDFMNISAVGGDQRGVPESTTATQAQIVQSNSMLRDNKGRMQVADFLNRVVWLMLQTMRESMALSYWVKLNVDPTALGAEMEVMRVVDMWTEIQKSQLGDFPFDVSIDVENLSPVTEQQRKAEWGQTMQLLSNPAAAMLLSMSEPLLRKTLYFQGIRSDQEINEIRQALVMTVMMMVGGQPGAPGAGPAASAPGPGAPPALTPGPTPPSGAPNAPLPGPRGLVASGPSRPPGD